MINYYKLSAIVSILFCSSLLKAQGGYPSFEPESDVTINGLTFDAMEPFISSDGTYLFFNNLNDGIDTKLYYATRINDSTFTYVGEVNGANQLTPPHLDAVADLDTLNNFYWTSTRNYPAELDNLFHGTFSGGSVSNIGRVHGDFNMSTPGWLMMDHGISYDGELLYFNNARFDPATCQGPCETLLGVAQKVNDSTFTTLPNSAALVATINDTNFNYYAPCISSNNLELYYTRYQRDTITPATQFDICVAVRSSPSDSFSAPVVLFSEFLIDLIEAPTLTKNMEIMYYHRRTPNSHKIVMRQRLNFANVQESQYFITAVQLYPNPASDMINIELSNADSDGYSIVITDVTGKIVVDEMKVSESKLEIDISSLSSGSYNVELLLNGGGLSSTVFVKH